MSIAVVSLYIGVQSPCAEIPVNVPQVADNGAQNVAEWEWRKDVSQA